MSHFHDREQVSPYPNRARPVNNVFIFLCAILNQIHTKFQCCELDLRSVVFVTLLQVWLTNSQEDMTKKTLNLVLIAAFPLNTTTKQVNLLKLYIFPFVLQQEHS